jgi:hypothetical protein
MKSHLHEIKGLSFLLFGCVLLYTIVMFLQLSAFHGESLYNPDVNHSYFPLKVGLAMVPAYSKILSAYNYSFAEFPVFRAFAKGPDQHQNMLKAGALGAVQVGTIYVTSGLLAVYLFGSSI